MSQLTERDMRRVNRYNLILKVCKQQKKIAEIAEAIPDYSSEMLRADCIMLAGQGYLKVELIISGTYKQKINYFTTLVSKFDESNLVSITTLIKNSKKQAKKQRISEDDTNKTITVYGHNNSNLIDAYREQSRQARREQKSPRNSVSGATLSASTW